MQPSPRRSRAAIPNPGTRRKAPAWILAAAAAAVLVALPGGIAWAHHSWQASDTRYAYYATGVVTYARWGNPHVELHLRVDDADMPADWLQRPLPPGAQEEDGRATMLSARPYDGEVPELHLTLAPPDYMVRWGLDRRIEVGERIEVVGFKNVGGGEEFRPVMFWVEGGQGVWQKLLSFPHQPEPAPAAQ